MHVLESAFTVAGDLDEVFAFFRDPRKLPLITPPWMRFTVTNCPFDVIYPGCEIDYTMRWLGVPLRWRTRITDYAENERFTDIQVRGPYARWWHEHRFAAVAGGVRVSDRIEYALPFGPLGGVVHALVVGRQLAEILAYREARAKEIFAAR